MMKQLLQMKLFQTMQGYRVDIEGEAGKVTGHGGTPAAACAEARARMPAAKMSPLAFIHCVVDDRVPAGTVEFRAADGRLLGKIEGLEA